ncbi:hypothetical protein B0H14DRAFT_3642439 [Mycena olivaceomarginata]|nr:hypothetical protein B0H14DRAFT_3642439 [Mycena olivaceomarginata]
MPKPSLRPSTLAPAPPTPSRALLAQFLMRPSKWYARSASAPRVSGLAAAGNEISPRASTSSVASGPSGARRPKISRPTDPRPIFGCGGLYGCAGESPSHLGRASLALREGSHRFICLFFALLLPPMVVSSRVGGTIPAETQTCVLRKEGEGAAESISVLSSTCPAPPSHSPRPPRRPAHTQNLHGSRVRERETRDRNGSGGGSPVSISISAPVLAGAGACGGADGSGIAPGHVPTRSHSFTPKLSSRLVNLGGASPVERNGRDGKEKEKHSVGFPFHFGGAQSKPLPPDPASLAPPHTHIILEPAPEEEDASSKTTNTTLRGRGRHPGLGVAGAGAAAPGGVFGAEVGKAGPKGRIEKGTWRPWYTQSLSRPLFLRADTMEEEAARCEEEWRDYALAVLFSLHLLAGRARVETEFVRCAGYLVRCRPILKRLRRTTARTTSLKQRRIAGLAAHRVRHR